MPTDSVPSATAQAATVLDEWISRAPTAFIADLTPALAEVLINRNLDNRKLSQPTVDLMARDMREGRWQLNGESIIISDDGHLNDGQHRCWAVVESGVTIPTLFALGVSRDSRLTVDQGKVRTTGDYLQMHGTDNARHVATAALYLWQYREYGKLPSGTANRASKSALVKFVADHPIVEDSVRYVAGPIANRIAGIGLLAFCHAVMSTAGDANEFIQKLLHGEELTAGDPILYVRNRLIMMPKRKMGPAPRAELLFRAWNSQGETVRVLPVLGGELPKLVNFKSKRREK